MDSIALLLADKPISADEFVAFPSQWQPYLNWLLAQTPIPASYLSHPFASRSKLEAAKKDIAHYLGYSLGQFIRLLRVNHILQTKAQHEPLYFATLFTPLAPMLAIWQTNQHLCLLEFAHRKALPSEMQTLKQHFPGSGFVPASAEMQAPLIEELRQYFAGKRQYFNQPLSPIGSPFQQQAWRALQSIPYGDTRSYKQQAQAMAHPNAHRAIAQANGKNPIAILIPCHRLIGSDGSLKGYGGGIACKQALLALEAQHKAT